MSLNKKIPLFIGIVITSTVLLIAFISIYSIYDKGKKDIAQYKEQQMDKAKQALNNYIDLGYGILIKAYKSSDSTELDKAVNILSNLRYDDGSGYFWITQNDQPTSTMIMHAARPDKNGKPTNDPADNVVKEKTGTNLYQEQTTNAMRKGLAFVNYTYVKPGQEKVFNKLSLSKAITPLNWVISTGIYTDQIDNAVAAQKAAIDQQIFDTSLLILGVAAFLIAVGIFVAVRFSRKVTSVISKVGNNLRKLSEGKTTEEIEKTTNDELGDMTDSLNSLVGGMQHYSDFARQIGDGKLQAKFNPLSDEDILGNELLSMRDNLAKNEQESKIRNWFTEGIALFSGILRGENDLKKLSANIVRNLVSYLEANQGSMFLLLDEDKQEPYLELMSTYAYDREKFLKRRFALGEGLAGQCVLEGKPILLTEIPGNYINITSGLGEATPTSILLVPLRFNEKTFGVLEVASFNKFGKHEMEFLEKLGEDIASTVSTVLINEKTKRLLEESKEMAENIQAQEEELRQNSEELQATQEQMQRRQLELQKENALLKTRLGLNPDEEYQASEHELVS